MRNPALDAPELPLNCPLLLPPLPLPLPLLSNELPLTRVRLLSEEPLSPEGLPMSTPAEYDAARRATGTDEDDEAAVTAAGGDNFVRGGDDDDEWDDPDAEPETEVLPALSPSRNKGLLLSLDVDKRGAETIRFWAVGDPPEDEEKNESGLDDCGFWFWD